MKNAGKVVSREDLLRDAWAGDLTGDQDGGHPHQASA